MVISSNITLYFCDLFILIQSTTIMLDCAEIQMNFRKCFVCWQLIFWPLLIRFFLFRRTIHDECRVGKFRSDLLIPNESTQLRLDGNFSHQNLLITKFHIFVLSNLCFSLSDLWTHSTIQFWVVGETVCQYLSPSSHQWNCLSVYESIYFI